MFYRVIGASDADVTLPTCVVRRGGGPTPNGPGGPTRGER